MMSPKNKGGFAMKSLMNTAGGFAMKSLMNAAEHFRLGLRLSMKNSKREDIRQLWKSSACSTSTNVDALLNSYDNVAAADSALSIRNTDQAM